MEDETYKFWKDMDFPDKQELYNKFVEEEEAKYKARKEEELLKGEDSETY